MGKIYTVTLKAQAREGSPAWTKDRDALPFIASVNPEIAFVHCDHSMSRIKFTHANQAEISQIWLTIFVAAGQFSQLLEIASYVESHTQHLVLQQRKHIQTGSQMKDCLR